MLLYTHREGIPGRERMVLEMRTLILLVKLVAEAKKIAEDTSILQGARVSQYVAKVMDYVLAQKLTAKQAADLYKLVHGEQI